MGNNIFQVLLATIKAKVTPIVTKIKYWTSWNFIRTKLISSFRDFFFKLLDIKPRHKKDYYGVFGWLISKRLVTAVVVGVGVISLIYLLNVQGSMVTGRVNGLSTYDYDSLFLRFADEKVRIKAKDGYVAYEGDVSQGAVNGYGTLFNEDGIVVYQGNFENNKYEGKGIRYYDNGVMRYNGDFHENKFDGEGKLYRNSGSIEYSGGFVQNMKEGEGNLYDSTGKPVYTGSFSQDRLVYSELLGKKVSEIAGVYSGRRTLYEMDSEIAVILEDIDAMYVSYTHEASLDSEMSVESIAVLNDTFFAGSNSYSEISELREYFGNADYEGNSVILMNEAVAINRVADAGNVYARKVDMTTYEEYIDYIVVEDFDDREAVYLYSFHKDGLVYTFVCQEQEAGFLFYSIEKEEGGEA